MANYEPTEWNTGDIVTAEKLNKIENQLAQNDVSTPIVMSISDFTLITNAFITDLVAVNDDWTTKAMANPGVEQFSFRRFTNRQTVTAMVESMSIFKEAYDSRRPVYVQQNDVGLIPLTVLDTGFILSQIKPVVFIPGVEYIARQNLYVFANITENDAEAIIAYYGAISKPDNEVAT